MDAERFARLRALYDAVVDLAPAARAEALARNGADAELAREALALCAAGDRDRTGALSRARDALLPDATAPQPQAGDRLGPWRIVAEIGQGGMGRVYRVERDDGSYAQTAALKFINGFAGDGAVAHFTRERQLLANLTHPNIARLLDGGTSAQGQPFLVMEYVDGEPIDVHCRRRGRSRNAILDLFVAACAAVSHAHRQLVVHCDLKPSNILVTAQGQPILLDFGIAQLADRVADDASAISGEAAPGYTPNYASPEQVRGERVGTASDVYSLGVVLREILEAGVVAPGRELAAILAKATRHDATARYASVDALCDDIASLRAHQPVSALPATPAYRVARFVRRRWPALLAVAGVLLLSIAFTWRVMAENRRAQRAEQAALADRDRALVAERDARASEASARETAAFLTSVFQGANPDAGSGTVSIATLLDQALLRIERDLSDQPATRAQVSAALADVLFLVGRSKEGRALYARAIALERTQSRPMVLAEMLVDNANQYLRHQPGEVPLDDVREAMRLVERHAEVDSGRRIALLLSAASLLGDEDPAEATPLLEQALAQVRRTAPDSLQLVETLATFGWNERRRGDYERAIALMQEGVALRLRLSGDAHEEYATALASTANTLNLARRFDEADALFLKAEALDRREGRRDSVAGAWALAQHAQMLRDAGRVREALALYDEILAIGARKLAPDAATLLVWNQNLANALAAAGDPERAAALIRTTVAKAPQAWAEGHSVVLRMQVMQARILAWQDCDPEAGAASRTAVAAYATQRPPGDAEFEDARIARGQWLVECGRLDEAGAILSEVARHLDALKPVPALQLAQAQARLRLQRDGDEAALDAAIAAEALAVATYASGDPRAALAAWPRAQWLQAHQRGFEAAVLARTMLSGVEGRLVPESPWYARLRAMAAAP